MVEVAEKSNLIFVDKILDNVHGFIYFTEAERKIINTQLFKRLQSIKQLSVANWIFPGSEHTRYVHSLGVMHIADRIAQKLELSTDERKIIRLAGLLHDIGHYPLSHVCEAPYKHELICVDEEQYCDSVNQAVIHQIETFKIPTTKEYMNPSRGGHHEAIGSLIISKDEKIRQILSEECGEDAIGVICDIIVGRLRPESDPLLVQILHSELDADGIDYLLRDAAFSGTSFGHFELDLLINSFEKREFHGKQILCISPKGIAAADQYLINKFFSYSQVIFNKHVTNLEWMAEQIVDWVQKGEFNKRHTSFPSKETLLNDWLRSGSTYNEFLAFTDNFFWSALNDIVKNPAAPYLPTFITTFCNKLLHHEELDYVENSEVKFISAIETNIQDELKKSSYYVDLKSNLLPDNIFALLHTRTMTKQTPDKEFNKMLDELSYGEEDKDIDIEDVENMRKNMSLSRFIECICVVDDDDMHLLCDDKRSLMQQLYNSTLVILRCFHFPISG